MSVANDGWNDGGTKRNTLIDVPHFRILRVTFEQLCVRGCVFLYVFVDLSCVANRTTDTGQKKSCRTEQIIAITRLEQIKCL